MTLTDTHCHIHSKDFNLKIDDVFKNAEDAQVKKLICVGTDVEDSKLAVRFARDHKNCKASIGLHPHDAKLGDEAYESLASILDDPDNLKHIVAIGECGLDYYYNNSAREDQIRAFKFQVEFANKHNLPMIFHVRDAFDDFWEVIREYRNIRGVVHSFTDSADNLQKIIDRGFYVGVNGIATFAKNESQINMYKSIPLSNLLLETDAPFLTPVPFRGIVNEPAHIKTIATFLSQLRGESIDDIARQTTNNAIELFSL